MNLQEYEQQMFINMFWKYKSVTVTAPPQSIMNRSSLFLDVGSEIYPFDYTAFLIWVSI